MVFITENWFWRGTQSAIFYYLACTPWVEYKHKRKRRREAADALKKRNEIIAKQPDAQPQPGPFETNEGWAEEILRGPHPPKGWKKDPLYYKYAKKMKEMPELLDCKRVDTATSSSTPGKSDYATSTSAPPTPTTPTSPQLLFMLAPEGIGRNFFANPVNGEHHPAHQHHKRMKSNSEVDISLRHNSPEPSSTAVDSRPSVSPIGLKNLHSSSSDESDSTKSKRASFESFTPSERRSQTPRPSMEKRLSCAMDSFKDAVRTTLHPDKWNWIRYERDDEVLSNFNDKVRSVWGSVTGQSNSTGEERDVKLKKVDSKSEVKKWQRGTHPAINDLHPPVVSQLPYTSEEAKWMLLPPASADVMMGRSRPDPFDDFNRRPLSVIGRPQQVHVASKYSKREQVVSSEEDNLESSDAEDSSDGEWFTGMSHLQKPQRAHLWKHRVASEP